MSTIARREFTASEEPVAGQESLEVTGGVDG
jgi:hypothetical protein